LALGIASTGVLTFAYFAAAGHAIDQRSYDHIALLWAVLFTVVSVLYRPVEQLLSRSIADRIARGHTATHPLRTPAVLQAAFAGAFVALAVLFREPITDDLFDGDGSLYWILLTAAVAYAASYFARGYLAGHKWFALYGGLVFFEALARLCFPLAVLVGLASGETAVALGIVAAPLASLAVVPWAILRHHRSGMTEDPVSVESAGGARTDAQFAGSVSMIQLSEQALLNAAVLLVPSAAGLIFSALLIARAPLQLFQAIQTSLLPHLAGLEATEGHAAFSRAIKQTVLAISGFATLVTVGLLAIGPWAVETIFNQASGQYDRGLAWLAVGMGLHLVAGTFTQAALARGRAHQAAVAWLVSAGLFVLWMLSDIAADPLHRTELGYAGTTAVLCTLLYGLYRAGPRAPVL
jgi:O-antigen/teichoic acid export membrane protein